MVARVERFREIEACRADEFVRLGQVRRHFFPHRVYYVPKCGPDGYKLATRMCGPCRLDELWEVLLYAAPEAVEDLPRELFFDDDLVWHQQQFGRSGLIATANMVVRGDTLQAMVLQADIVQRAARHPAHRTHLQKRFKGWHRLLLNAILNFALERSIRTVHVPVTALALAHTDPKRRVGPSLFERVYDQNVRAFCEATREGDWWRIDVRENAGRVLRPRTGTETIAADRTLCVCHDIEGGLGHVDADPAFASRASTELATRLSAILEIEAASDVRATYHVVGKLMGEVRDDIEAGGHILGFHSYDHRTESEALQLPRCREIDYRIKGYRVPQSKLTPELTDENLCFHNFEWLASSAYSLGFDTPRLENRIVKAPIAFDDYQLYRNGLAFDEWQARALDTITDRAFVAFSLHDCYAELWLPGYRAFLARIRGLGALKTMDDVAAELTLGSAA